MLVKYFVYHWQFYMYLFKLVPADEVFHLVVFAFYFVRWVS